MSEGRCFVFWKHSFPAVRNCYKHSKVTTISTKNERMHLSDTTLTVLPGNDRIVIVDPDTCGVYMER